jgi:hypothetical protein
MAQVKAPLDLRYSPSGPFIGTLEGHPFEGLQLRLKEAGFSVAQLDVDQLFREIVSPTGEKLEVVLDAPQPNRMYKVTSSVTYTKLITGTGQIDFFLEASYDDRNTWTHVGGNTYASQYEDQGPKQAVVNRAAALGSDWIVPVPEGAETMIVRLVVRDPGGSGNFRIPEFTSAGNYATLSLAELQG